MSERKDGEKPESEWTDFDRGYLVGAEHGRHVGLMEGRRLGYRDGHDDGYRDGYKYGLGDGERKYRNLLVGGS